MSIRKQDGAVLLVCLVMILILTMIGVASMSNSTLQERMAGGMRDYNVAFQAAEAALRAGEEELRKRVEMSADPVLLFATKESCAALTSAQWKAPDELTAQAKAPTCQLINYYAGAGGAGASVCETDGSLVENRPFECLSQTYLFNVEAVGYGGGDLEVHLRSTVAIAISIQD